MLKQAGQTPPLVTTYDAICVGAGPANLALAEELLRHDSRLRILIIDKGRGVARRRCPLAEAKECPPCGLCHAVHGVAGAGAYSDGKISFWPAGSGLEPLAGGPSGVLELDGRLRTYYARLLKDASSYTTCSDAHGLAQEVSRNGVELKPYDVAHAGSEAVQEFYADKHDRLVEAGVLFLLSAHAIDIHPRDGAYEVRWRSPAGLQSAAGRQISLGVGKASGLWLRAMLDKLGVVRHYSEIEVGVRLEFPYPVTEAVSRCHRDAKFKMAAPDGSEVRTFCFCHRGFVLAAYYDDMTTVSGFSLRDRHSDKHQLRPAESDRAARDRRSLLAPAPLRPAGESPRRRRSAGTASGGFRLRPRDNPRKPARQSRGSDTPASGPWAGPFTRGACGERQPARRVDAPGPGHPWPPRRSQPRLRPRDREMLG
jgi:uncharacterized FAD-dependent dehydrogenase